jgi:ABC-type multidrug transport system fused ATPase/permease subunit
VIDTYRKLFDLLAPHERRRFYQLLGMIIVMGLVDMVGVASILPFLAVVANPEIAQTNQYLALLHDGLDFQSDRSFLIFLGALVFFAIILGLVFKTVTLLAIARFSHFRNHTIGSRLLRGYLGRPYVWFLDKRSADLGRTVLNEVNIVVGNALIPAMRILAQSVSLLFLAGLLFLVDPVVATSSVLVLGGSYMLIFLLVRRYLSRIGRRYTEANQTRFHIAHEVFGGIKDVKLLGLEEAYLDRFHPPSVQVAVSASFSQVISELPRYLLETIAFGGMILLILALLLAGNGSLSDILPVLGVFAFAGLRMFPAVQQIYHALSYLRYTGAALEIVHRDTMETRENLLRIPGAEVPPLHVHRQIALADVHYAYPKAERAALQGLSLAIAANTTVGIVGGTGAGKTTAVDVMLGLLAPQAGQLRVDGEAITPANLRAWQNSVGYVAQQIFLIDDSVAANIAFGIAADAIDMAAVERAARVANLHDFVTGELPQGYQTAVGERGVRLSGGQRQRIGIARALYHDPDVLLLDEATSALDNLTERAVMEAVHNLGHQKTIIMIAHRLTTVKDCDMIFLLENGQLAAQGRYDDLLRDSEIFRRMATA